MNTNIEVTAAGPPLPDMPMSSSTHTPGNSVHEKIVAMNQALILGSLRQHELTEAAERLNTQLLGEIADREAAEREVRKLNAELAQRVEARTAELRAANNLLKIEVAERKLAEIELVKAFHVADDANRAKSDFLARMSHEIRTPMNGIIGISYLLKQSTMSQKQCEYTSKIEYSAQKLMGIINDLLDFSKIEAGKMRVESAEFNLGELLSRLLEFMSFQAQRKALGCKLTLAPDVPLRVIGDSLRLGQVLTNLVSNAIKFTDRGKIEVTVAVLEQSDAQVLLEFTVQDTGIGIDVRYIANLFEPFNQSDTSIARRFGGTGLGLAISKRFVQLLGGVIRVQSEPGIGSRFSFTARFEIDPQLKRDYAKKTAVTVRRRALIVDSDAASSLQTAALLHELSTDTECVVTRADAVQALSLLSDKGLQRYDMVLLECSLPQAVSMYDAKRIRRECGDVYLPPFIFIGSNVPVQIQAHLKNEGFDGFAVKPLTRSALEHATRQALMKKPKFEVIARRTPTLQGARILVVEDDEINQQIAAEILEQAGCEVVCAGDGRQAISILHANSANTPFAAILMDIHMPIMDGYEATLQIRADCRYEGLPIIALTADAVQGVKKRCIEAGMNAFLTKPFEATELYAVLERWVVA